MGRTGDSRTSCRSVVEVYDTWNRPVRDKKELKGSIEIGMMKLVGISLLLNIYYIYYLINQ